ncbi:MAG: YbjN domain-containing protein [Kofleriaceae bacterium]|jgi:hypothetical protein|nr:YbjN domain-containing protein [Kofleriaceae bacterium]MBP6836951.1 YbjN domain-containing protein [Kofleriaceae bacterium]MBP9204583.1 YbjN domain-containing protein [Kofleriaceae bacterium]
MPSALFANQRETNLASAITMVEDVLIERGLFLGGAVIEQPGALRAWRFTSGSASITVALLDRPRFSHLRVEAGVLTIDDRVDLPALFADLLARNRDLAGAAFALDGRRVLLVSERTTLDLDRSEVQHLIATLAAAADAADDELVARHGGTRGA